MSNENYLDGVATVGTVGVAVLSAFNPALLLGIPIIWGARALRAKRDNEERKRKAAQMIINNKREERAMIPRALDPILPSKPYTYPYPLCTSSIEPPVNPLTMIAVQNPKLAANLIETKCLTDAHKRITEKPAAIFASQGRGMVATTTRRKGFFSDSITTVIRPL